MHIPDPTYKRADCLNCTYGPLRDLLFLLGTLFAEPGTPEHVRRKRTDPAAHQDLRDDWTRDVSSSVCFFIDYAELYLHSSVGTKARV